MTKELYINDYLIDIDENDNPISLTFAVNDLADLQDRQSNSSNTIKFPKTANNCAAMGWANIDAFTQDEPYQLLPAKVVYNGIEVIPNGFFTLQQVTDNFEGQIIAGIGGLGTAISDKKLVDIDFSDLDHVYSTQKALASLSSVTGYIYPIIDYGTLPVTGTGINLADLYPAVFTKTIIDKIVTQAGYTYSGTVFSDPVFMAEIIPFTNDLFGQVINGVNTRWPVGQTISVATLMPDIAQVDFLKDWMQRYGLTPVVDNYRNHITFRSFKELYDNKSIALDWTNKFIDDGQRTDAFIFGNYAQVNNAIFKSDDLVTALYGNGSFNVDNTNLDGQVDIFTSVFAASLTVNKLNGVDMASIQKYDPLDATVNNTTQPRVLLVQNITNTTGVSIVGLTDNPATITPNIICVAYFKKTGYPGLGYDDMLTRNYQDLFLMLAKARVVTRSIMLNEMDIQQLDHFVPIYDSREAQYYYLNQITNYIPGLATQVELIRM